MRRLVKALIVFIILGGIFSYFGAGAYFSSPVDPETFKKVWDERFVYLHPKGFIKPTSQEVKEAYSIAVRSRLFGSDIEKVRHWIATNIRYVPDFEQYSWYECLKRNGDLHEYWQYPNETLGKRTGDCEDVAMLMVSMLRAGGYPAEDVFVVLGSDGEVNHAWVEANGKTYEPMAGNILQEIYGEYKLANFEAYYKFNDEYLFKI
jgi:transglutaminase-like putative cysteine protease